MTDGQKKAEINHPISLRQIKMKFAIPLLFIASQCFAGSSTLSFVPVREIIIKQSTFSANAWLWTITNSGVLNLISTTTAADYTYFPLSPVDEAYFYRLDADTDGAFEINKADINVRFPSLLIETPDGKKIYKIGVTTDGVITSNLQGAY